MTKDSPTPHNQPGLGTASKRKCEVCRSERSVSVRAPWPVVRCFDCGLVYARGLESSQGSEGLYEEAFVKGHRHPTYAFNGSEYAARGTERWAALLRRLEEYKKCCRILDIGCSLGFLLHQAQCRGWEAYGLEVSAFACEFAHDKFGIHMHHGILQEGVYAEGFFDVVICSHVLEHVPSPRRLVQLIRSILRPKGAALILVPTQFSSPSYKLFGGLRGDGPPLHLHFFSRRTLICLLKQEQFRVCRSEMNTQLAYLAGDVTRSEGVEKRLEQASEQVISEAPKTISRRFRNAGIRAVKAIVNRIGTLADFGDELIVYAERIS